MGRGRLIRPGFFQACHGVPDEWFFLCSECLSKIKNQQARKKTRISGSCCTNWSCNSKLIRRPLIFIVESLSGRPNLLFFLRRLMWKNIRKDDVYSTCLTSLYRITVPSLKLTGYPLKIGRAPKGRNRLPKSWSAISCRPIAWGPRPFIWPPKAPDPHASCTIQKRDLEKLMSFFYCHLSWIQTCL